MSEERFFDEFAEDFFAESTEHLATIRRVLLEVETAAAASMPTSRREVTELLRSLHTLKGLSGMVGLTSAASVAHAMEEALRLTDVGARAAPIDAVGAMFDAAQALENALHAYRAGSPEPVVESAIEQLHATARPVANTSDEKNVNGGANEQFYTFTFRPSAELTARGVTVDVVRTRLQSLGSVVRVVPRVAQDSAILFEFTVSVVEARQPNEEWRSDGIDWVIASEIVAAPFPTTEGMPLPRSSLVRVELARLDDLMLLVGDLVMSRARLQDTVDRLQTNRTNSAVHEVENVSDLLERQLRDLRAAVMRVRLVPVGEAFERMRFVARDVARETAKQARVEVEGGATEIDKIVVERMLEPLLHLVRNAMSHGIESPQSRELAGKDPIGVIKLRAESAGDEIIIHVEDDGAGIDVEHVRKTALARGIAPSAVENASVIDILALPGFSTQTSADMASGRGVGMAVVRSTVRELGGDLTVETRLGEGTRFTVRLPLTLMIVDALLVSVAGQIMAVPQPSLREVLQIEDYEVVSFENNEAMTYRSGVLPLIRLRGLFGAPPATVRKANVLVVGAGRQAVGLVVDRVLGLREIVVRPLADPLVSVPGIAGAAELSDGTVTLILDTSGLVQFVMQHKQRSKANLISSFGALQKGRSA